MKKTATASLSCKPSELTAGDLADWLGAMHPSSPVRVSVDHGDRPGELGLVTFLVTLAGDTEATS